MPDGDDPAVTAFAAGKRHDEATASPRSLANHAQDPRRSEPPLDARVLPDDVRAATAKRLLDMWCSTTVFWFHRQDVRNRWPELAAVLDALAPATALPTERPDATDCLTLMSTPRIVLNVLNPERLPWLPKPRCSTSGARSH
jgi:hypothetical protein